MSACVGLYVVAVYVQVDVAVIGAGGEVQADHVPPRRAVDPREVAPGEQMAAGHQQRLDLTAGAVPEPGDHRRRRRADRGDVGDGGAVYRAELSTEICR